MPVIMGVMTVFYPYFCFLFSYNTVKDDTFEMKIRLYPMCQAVTIAHSGFL